MKRSSLLRLLISCGVVIFLTLAVGIYIFFNRDLLTSFPYAEVVLACYVCTIFVLLFSVIFFLYLYIKKSTRKHDEHLRFEKQRYKAIVESSQWDVWEYDFSTNIISSDTFNNFKPLDIELFHAAILNHNLSYSGDYDIIEQCFSDIKNGKKDIYAEFRLKLGSKDYEWYELTGTTIYDEHNQPLTAIAKTVNVDRRKKEIEELRFSTERDPLTHLYNFSTIQTKTNDAIAYSDNSNLLHGALIIDIDNFNDVWESLGHSFSNAILIDFANKLNKRIGRNAFAGYVAYNRFIVLLKDMTSVDYSEKVAQNIQHIFKELYLGIQENLTITCSIGISIFPLDATSGEELIENADIALYMAKKSGKNCIKSYEKPFRSLINMSEYLTKSIKSRTLRPLQDSHSMIDNDLIFNIVDILFDSRDLDTALNMALTLLGNYYSIDQLGIYEKTNDNMLKLTYVWNNSLFEPFANSMKSFSVSEGEKFALYKSSLTGIYSTNSVNRNEFKPSVYKDLLTESGLKCIYQCGISDNGDYSGYFFAHSLNQRDDWSTNIIDSLTLLAKVMGGYLIKHRSTQTMDRMLQYDTLTGASNLRLFTSQASEILNDNSKQRYVIIYLDIKKFKYINETYGYATGDYILRAFSDEISKALYEGEIYCRVVDDKFIILAEYSDLETLKSRMSDFSQKVYMLKKAGSDNYKIMVNAGLYLITKFENISLLIDRANIARKSIKNSHVSNFAFFNDSMRNLILKQKELENTMETALNNNEFCVYLQPKYNILTNKVCGAEALVRWNRPGYGIIPPSEFIPFFEENSFITEIDYYVFDKICELIRYMLDHDITPVPISINFSRIHLNNRRILSKLKDSLKKYDLTPEYLEIEITESSLVESDVHMLKVLVEIQKLGFKLAMDDFGSGLSSLNSLRKLPFEILKLDKDFFQGDNITHRERVVISNIVRLAKELDMGIVAEGVETPEQTQFLREIECPVIQGYIFSKPVPKDEYLDRFAS